MRSHLKTRFFFKSPPIHNKAVGATNAKSETAQIPDSEPGNDEKVWSACRVQLPTAVLILKT